MYVFVKEIAVNKGFGTVILFFVQSLKVSSVIHDDIFVCRAPF